jgi:tetratricopeptide (TPR) repeat protein
MKRRPNRAPRKVPLGRARADFSWQTLIAFAALLATLLAVYSPAISGQLLWDDDFHVPTPEMRSLHGLVRIWIEPGSMQQYYPLVDSAFWVMHALWGDWTPGYHLVTIAMHFAAAVLVFVVLQRLMIPGAMLAAAIFALHPLHVESVAWITELKNTMSAVFYLAALLLYLRFDQERRGSLYAWALGLFVLALLSKTVTVTLPAALLVIFWWQRGTLSWQKDVVPLVPFFVVGSLSGAMTAWMEWNHVGASGAPFELSWVQRLLLSGRIPWFYLWKLFWPAELIFVYPRWEIDPLQWWQYLFPIATAALIALSWLMRRWSRAHLAAVLFFGGSLFPALGFLNVYYFKYSYVSDHFPYLASLGVIALVSAALATLLARHGLWQRPAGNALCVGLLAVLAVLSWRETPAYADNRSLFEATIDRNPGAWMAHYNLGLILMGRGDNVAAAERFRAVIEIRPEYGDAHNNLGLTFLRQGRNRESLEHFRRTLDREPDHHLAHANLGLALQGLGRVAEAIDEYAAAVQAEPDFAEGYNQWGQVLMSSKDFEAALAHFQTAVRIRPDFAAARFNLAQTLMALGRTGEAVAHFQEVVRISPGDANAHLNLGHALGMQGRIREAVLEFEEAVRLNPDNPHAVENLRWARSLPR